METNVTHTYIQDHITSLTKQDQSVCSRKLPNEQSFSHQTITDEDIYLTSTPYHIKIPQVLPRTLRTAKDTKDS